jgi:hypothetical protein
MYAHLGDELVPRRSSEPPDSSPNPMHRPPPANLDVAEHRHQLLRGLRWWADAVGTEGAGRHLGESVAHMCAWLIAHLGDMAAEDQETLYGNLNEWLAKATGMAGGYEPPAEPFIRVRDLPAGAEDSIVSVAVAAKVLGVSVRTIQRRSPNRFAGQVRLRDVMSVCIHDLVRCVDCAH